MLILRVDDVGRRPEDGPERGTDSDLEYFAKWRGIAGLAGLPVVYGVVPAWLSPEAAEWLADNLQGDETVAIHGYSHTEGESVGVQQMRDSATRFNSTCYIPPFNLYSGKTIEDWGKAGGKYFLGGFDKDHHHCGSTPVSVRRVLHIPATVSLYGRARDVMNGYERMSQARREAVLVATLHVPWDVHPSIVGELVATVREDLVPLSAVHE